MSRIFKQTESQMKRQKKFIEKAKIVHKNKYNYNKVVYVNNKTKIKIICPIHGEFEQIPCGHLKGYGCRKCGKLKPADSRRLSLQKFIEKAEEKHGNIYDYSKVIYKHSKTKICIICSIHGEFWQTPNKHLNGSGCLKCADIKRMKNLNYISGQYTPKYPEKYIGKNINSIIYRSSYELKAFEMIEEDKNILKWESESIVIPYELNKKTHNYYVDLKLETKDGIKLIEIKPFHKTQQPKYLYEQNEYKMNQAKWKAARRYCKERNWEFIIWTEKELKL